MIVVRFNLAVLRIGWICNSGAYGYNLNLSGGKAMADGKEEAPNHMKAFGVTLLILELIICILYGVFVRPDPGVSSTHNYDRYPAYQDINVMMLIGFGFLMTFSKTASWTAVCFVFFINAFCVQLYILLNGFFYRLIHSGFDQGKFIKVTEVTMTAGLYCAASMFVSIGVYIGRVGPFETLIAAIFHTIGYAINEVLVYEEIKAFDVGGSTAIHAFGAYGGMTLSLIIGWVIRPEKKPEASYHSNLFAFIGTAFLWMFWPSFNFGLFSTTAFMKSQIITNTILALAGSCTGTYLTSALLKNKFNMEHVLNATLAGGVAIGAPASIFFNSGASLMTGLLVGIISTLCFQYLGPWLEEKCGLYDTCGVHNLHGVPGVLGAIVSAIGAASYNSSNTIDLGGVTSTEFPALDTLTTTPWKQGGLQIAALFCSMGIGIVANILAGLVIRCFYGPNPDHFHTDKDYFDDAEELLEEQHPVLTQPTNRLPPVEKGAEFLPNSSFGSMN